MKHEWETKGEMNYSICKHCGADYALVTSEICQPAPKESSAAHSEQQKDGVLRGETLDNEQINEAKDNPTHNLNGAKDNQAVTLTAAAEKFVFGPITPTRKALSDLSRVTAFLAGAAYQKAQSEKEINRLSIDLAIESGKFEATAELWMRTKEEIAADKKKYWPNNEENW